jgi:hypothetical protein
VIQGFTALKYIDLSGTNLTDDGAADLRHLLALTHVNLQDTSISDAAVPALLSLKLMQDLNLCGTHVTAEGIAANLESHSIVPSALVVDHEVNMALSTLLSSNK